MMNKCDSQISNCNHLKILEAMMQPYNKSSSQNKNDYDTHNVNILQLLNSFIHLIHEHANDEEFEFITKELGSCDMIKCNIFKRNRDKNKRNNDIKITKEKTTKNN
eukprot:365371_1